MSGLLCLAACSSSGGEVDSSLDDLRRLCALGSIVKGIDVSKWQGDIDLSRVHESDVDFVFVRVSDGGKTTDSKFAANWEGAKAAGLYRGAYQYFRAGQDAAVQAVKLIEAVGVLGPGDLPPVLDIESDDGQSAAVVIEKSKIWLERVESATGKKPIVYTYGYFWESLNATSSDFSSYPLWVANYQVSCPRVPDGWERWTVWQASSKGRVAGIEGDVDLDVFSGSIADLAAFAGGTPPMRDDVLAKGATATVNTALLNLRSGGGTANSIVTQMPCGTAVTLIQRNSSGWWQVRYGDVEGWCSGRYLAPKNKFDAAVCSQ